MPIPQIPQYTTTGSFRSVTILSGIIAAPGLQNAPGAVAAGSDVLLYSGTGRLHSVQIFNTAVSGSQVLFFDNAVALSGSLYSGSPCIGAIPAWPNGSAVSGQTPSTTQFVFNSLFYSGLVVGVRSGCPSFTVNFTPEDI